jgi:hypothetical protein
MSALEEKLKLFVCSEDDDALRDTTIGVPYVISENITFVV